MENKQYDYENLNQKDMFQEYIDSLPEEGEEKEEAGSHFSGVSKQVEEDLLDYKRKGYDKKRRSSSSGSRRKKRNSAKGPVAAVIVAATAIIAAAGLTTVMIARNTYAEPVYYDDPYIVEEYEDPWQEAYQQMSGTLASPEAIVDGHYISLPLKVSDFMQDDWKIRSSAFADADQTVGSQAKTYHVETEYGYSVAEISVVSPTGEEVALEDALITGVSFDSSGVWAELNDGVAIGSGTWTIEDSLNSDGIEWVKRGGEEGSRYIIESSAENEYGYDEYVLRLELQDDYTERIVMQMDQSVNPGE